MKTKLFILTIAILAFASTTFAQQDDCRHRNPQGVCTDVSWHIMLGDKGPADSPIIILDAPELSETQKRNILGYAAEKLTKDYGKNLLFVTDERHIQPNWHGQRHVITYKYNVQTVGGALEPITTQGALKRSSVKAGLRLIDVFVYSLPGNGRIANAGKAAGAEAAQEIGRAEADRRGLSRLNRDRIYAVTATLTQQSGKQLKAFRPETQYFKIRGLDDSQTSETLYYLVGEGDSPKQIAEMEPIVYLGSTTDAVDNALSEEMFIQLFRQGGSVGKQIRNTETQLKAASVMQNCKHREWSDEKNDWVCKDSAETKTAPPCKTQVRDSSGEWRCAAEQQQAAPARASVESSASQAPTQAAKATCPGGYRLVWQNNGTVPLCLPVSGPVPPPAQAKVEPLAQEVPAPQPPTTAVPVAAVGFPGFSSTTDFSPRTEAASRVNGFFCAGSGDHWFYTQWQSTWIPNISGPNSKKAIGEFQATNGLPVTQKLDFATLEVLNLLWQKNPQLFPTMEELLKKSPQPCKVRPSVPKK